MSIALDIVRTYRMPRRIQLQQMQAGESSEGRALAVLMGGCFLLFVATLPNLSREAYFDPSIPFQGRMAGSFFAWLLMMPLVFYVLSIIVTLLMKVLRLSAPGHYIRMALFWALLASSPLWLLSGLAAGFAGESPGTTLAGLAAVGAYLIFAMIGLVAAVRSGQDVSE